MAGQKARPVLADAHSDTDGVARVDEQLDRRRDAQHGTELIVRRRAQLSFVVARDRDDEDAGFRARE